MKKVLIIDDTKNIRILLQKVLQLEGFEAETASDGREGLDMIRRGDYSLIFMDIKLPEISGTEILRTIRAEGNNTPTIIMTAYATIKNAVDCIQLGAITYIQKPFTAERILNPMKQFNIFPGSDADTEGSAEVWKRIEEDYRDKNYQSTLKSLAVLLAQDPTNARIYLYLARCHEALGNTEEAEKFRKAYEVFQ